MQNDLQILSNDFKEGKMLMNFIKSNINKSSKREKFAYRTNKVAGSMYNKPGRFINTK